MDSKGVLWKVFAYFRPFTKVSARPGTRGKPCASRNPTRGHPQASCARTHTAGNPQKNSLFQCNDQKENNYPPDLKIRLCTSKSDLCSKSIKKKTI